MTIKPGFRCPALYGDSADRRLAPLTFLVEKTCTDGADQLRAVVEIFGFFCEPGQAHDENLPRAGCLAAPPGSLVARISCEVSELPDAITRAENQLRASIGACPCNVPGERPALADVRLSGTIAEAAGSLPPASWPLEPVAVS